MAAARAPRAPPLAAGLADAPSPMLTPFLGAGLGGEADMALWYKSAAVGLGGSSFASSDYSTYPQSTLNI